MKHTLAVTFEIDEAAWAAEYDQPGPAEAVTDITNVINGAASDGSLVGAITANWPMMRETAKVTVTPIAHALETLREQERTDQAQQLLDTVREAISKAFPARPAVAVVLDAEEWDNGYFLDHNGTVYFADGTHQNGVDLGIGDELAERYGVVGPRSGLGINLRTDDLDFDDYIGNVYDRLGIPTEKG